MRRSIEEIYRLIIQKRENAEKDREKLYKQRIYMQREKSIISYEYEGIVKQENRLIGEIRAYEDILCLIESSGVVEDEIIR